MPGVSVFATTAMPEISPPPHRHDQHVEVRHRIEHLQRHGALTDDDQRIIVGMNGAVKCSLRPCCMAEGGGIFKRGSTFDHIRAMPARVLDLQVRSSQGRNSRRYRKAGRVIGHTLRVVACRRSDYASPPLFGKQG